MFSWLNRFRPTISSIVENSKYEAERLALEHDMAGRHHLALAEMYRTRLASLNKLCLPDNASLPKPAAKKTLTAVPKTAT